VVALADAQIKAMVEANPKNADAYLIRARYRQAFAPPADRDRVKAEVERDVLEARKLAPEAVSVFLAVAELAREKKDPGLARELLRQGVKRHPREWRLVQARSQLEMLDDQPQAALAHLQDGL